jgi:hypothetical protein
MVEAGEPLQLRHLLDAVVAGVDDLDLHLDVRRFLPEVLVPYLGIGLGRLAIGFASLRRRLPSAGLPPALQLVGVRLTCMSVRKAESVLMGQGEIQE